MFSNFQYKQESRSFYWTLQKMLINVIPRKTIEID